MKFSILVPVYNVEKYIEQCVESLLSQTYKDVEIILVDDGSTDSSGEICDRYQKENPDIVKVIHKENEGLVSAREWGIRAASGDVALFVDSDDFTEVELLETVYDAFERYPDADMIIYSFKYFNNGGFSSRKSTLSDGESVFDASNKNELYSTLMFSTKITSLWTKAVRLKVLKADTTDYSLHYQHNMAEDLFRSIHLLDLCEKVVYINEPLYNYRNDNTSISRSFTPERISKMNTLYVYDRFREYLPKWGMDTKENIDRLNLKWFYETIYTFSRFYNGAKSRKDKKAVMDYNWNSMLPDEVLSENFRIPDNEKGVIYKCILEKNYIRLNLIYLKNNIYNSYKRIKR